MAERALLSPPRRDAAARNGSTRTVHRRRGLPSGRAVAGGFLVAVAAIGIYAAWRGASAGPTSEYVVASRRIPVGTRVAAADLATMRMELPPSLRRRAFADARALVGAATLVPIERGELIEAGEVAAATDRARHLSFPIEASRALNGTLAPGERVDVIATYGTGGGDSWTAVIAANVVVADVDAQGSSLDRGRSLVLTLALDDPEDVLAVTHAARSGTITLARAGDGEPGDAYRPAPPARETAAR